MFLISGLLPIYVLKSGCKVFGHLKSPWVVVMHSIKDERVGMVFRSVRNAGKRMVQVWLGRYCAVT